MKGHRFILYFTLAVLTSCQTITYEGSTDYSKDIYESSEIKVVLGQKSAPGTKAFGAIDTEEFWRWKDARIFIYAFKKDSTDFRLTSADSDNDICILDGASDGFANAGKAAIISGQDDEFLLWEKDGQKPVYPYGTDPYEFYAYHLDDCQVDNELITRTGESISMPVTITGAQDLMTAKATVSDAQLDNLGFSEEERAFLSNTSYSAYSANLGVHPELYFKHHLVRLDFEAYPHREEASEIWIQEVVVESRTEAEFTVAHIDTTKVGLEFAADQKLVPLTLMEKDYKTPMKRDTYKIPWVDSDASKPLYERSSLELGGSLLVSPEKEYNCTVKMRDSYDDDILYKFVIRSSNGDFEAGRQYTIRLSVYGRYQIIPEVFVKEWKDDGDYDLDI